MAEKLVRCCMDGIDWQHHLGHDLKGRILYPNRLSLEERTDHDLNECGIVEVEVKLIRWIVPQNLKHHKVE